MRKLEAIRDQIMRGVGTTEPYFQEDPREQLAATGRVPVCIHWRKPLSITEVAQMADTPDVRARQGRA